MAATACRRRHGVPIEDGAMQDRNASTPLRLSPDPEAHTPMEA